MGNAPCRRVWSVEREEYVRRTVPLTHVPLTRQLFINISVMRAANSGSITDRIAAAFRSLM